MILALVSACMTKRFPKLPEELQQEMLNWLRAKSRKNNFTTTIINNKRVLTLFCFLSLCVLIFGVKALDNIVELRNITKKICQCNSK